MNKQKKKRSPKQGASLGFMVKHLELRINNAEELAHIGCLPGGAKEENSGILRFIRKLRIPKWINLHCGLTPLRAVKCRYNFDVSYLNKTRREARVSALLLQLTVHPTSPCANLSLRFYFYCFFSFI